MKLNLKVLAIMSLVITGCWAVMGFVQANSRTCIIGTNEARLLCASGSPGQPIAKKLCTAVSKQIQCNDANSVPKCSGNGVACFGCKVTGEADGHISYLCTDVTDPNQTCTPTHRTESCGSKYSGTCTLFAFGEPISANLWICNTGGSASGSCSTDLTLACN